MRPLLLPALLLVLACACASDDDASQPIDAGRDASATEDAAIDSTVEAAVDAGTDAGPEPDASTPEPQCPPGTTRQYIGFSACSINRRECFEVAPGFMCARYPYTAEACTEAGGIIVSDSCPAPTSVLGTIDAETDLKLCCRDIRSCAPQIAQPQVYCTDITWAWTGSYCDPLRGCECKGRDCGAVFASESECLAAYSECIDIYRSCGTGSGGSCFADEYCAYVPPEECGHGDASATCQPRPTSCEDIEDPVCGCDFQTYANPCEAARAGQGIYELGICGSEPDADGG